MPPVYDREYSGQVRVSSLHTGNSQWKEGVFMVSPTEKAWKCTIRLKANPTKVIFESTLSAGTIKRVSDRYRLVIDFNDGSMVQIKLNKKEMADVGQLIRQIMEGYRLPGQSKVVSFAWCGTTPINQMRDGAPTTSTPMARRPMTPATPKQVKAGLYSPPSPNVFTGVKDASSKVQDKVTLFDDASDDQFEGKKENISMKKKMASGSEKNLLKKMEQLAECSICYDRLQDPRTLPCQHTFCNACLQTYVGNVRIFACPFCRQETRVPCSGVECFPKALHLGNILDILTENPPSSNTTELNESKEKSPTTELCDEHDEPISAFCQQCSSLVCKQCLLNTHSSHTCNNLVDEAARQRPTLKKLHAEMVEHVKELQSEELKVDVALTATGEKKMDAIGRLRSNVQKLLEIIKKHEEVIKEDINTAGDEAIGHFHSTKQTLASERAQLGSCIKQISQCLDDGTETEIIRAAVDQAPSIKMMTAPKDIPMPEFELDITFPSYEYFDAAKCVATVTHKLSILTVSDARLRGYVK